MPMTAIPSTPAPEARPGVVSLAVLPEANFFLSLAVVSLFVLSGCTPSSSSNPPPPPATPENGTIILVDVATAVGIDFSITPGPIFPELTLSGHIAMMRIMGNGVAVGDYDDDGDLDLYLLGHYDQANRLYRNEWAETGTATFTDVTPALLADTGLSRVAHFVDLDNDGLRDLLVINDDENLPTSRTSRIFKNQGGGNFEDRTPGSGFRPLGFLKGGAALVDYDRDGLIDIFVSNWGFLVPPDPTPDWPGQNQLYRNLGNFQFMDVTGIAIPTLGVNSFSAIFSDFDGDARPDLLVAVDGGPDHFYRSVGGVQFEDVSTAVGAVHGGNDMGRACADFDGDGDLDVYSTNISDPTGFYGMGFGNVLYENQLADSGSFSFIDRAADLGIEDTAWGWGTTFADLDLDGDFDLVAVNVFDEWILNQNPMLNTPSVLFVSEGGTGFTRQTGTGLDLPRDSRALVAFDYDRDGDLDLLVTNLAQRVQLFENQTVTDAHSLTVSLIPDALALGARIEATFDPDGPGGNPPQTARCDCIAGRSYLAGTPAEVVIGLGAATSADLRIVWADGSETLLPATAADQWLTVDGN